MLIIPLVITVLVLILWNYKGYTWSNEALWPIAPMWLCYLLIAVADIYQVF